MNKIYILLILMIISLNLQSQSDKINTNIDNSNKHKIKTNLLGIFTLFYEHTISNNMTLQVGLQYNPDNMLQGYFKKACKIATNKN